uniref:zinc finger protein 32-like n=1 Tax=Oncorhynchus gorbuscha TaxID=8017 RepID=UPI001EAF7A03|nr:zinc finger protein 32-like [Oncorhynchus gorbuscha]
MLPTHQTSALTTAGQMRGGSSRGHKQEEQDLRSKKSRGLVQVQVQSRLAGEGQGRGAPGVLAAVSRRPRMWVIWDISMWWSRRGHCAPGSYSLRHPKPTRPRTATGGPTQGGLAGQKVVLRSPGTVGRDSISPGRAGETAGPSTSPGDPDADRPHHCLECGKTFRLISSLKKHIRIHTGEKPYPCGVCGRRFRESGALKTHLRIHTGEKPYSCSECPKIFRHLDGLRKHQRTHTGDKPYVCAICGKRLSRLQHLKHHQRIHTGEKPCICPFCNRTFKEPAALRKHVRTHREESGNMEAGLGDEPDPEALDNINSLHPAAPSPQMRFDEWGAEGDDVDCV